jgi:hypothetical protein
MNPRIRFWVAQVLGYPVVLYLLWLWLGIPEGSALQLAGSVLLGLVIAIGLAWLLASAFEVRFPRMLVFVVLLAGFAGVAWWLTGYADEAGNWLAAKVSIWRRRPANPGTWALRYWWTVWTVFLLAIFGLLAWLAGGRRVLRRWPYWLLCVGLLISGAWMPWKVLWWVPKLDTITAQTVSMVLRFGVAYLLWLGSLLLFAAGVRRVAGSRF